MDPKFIVAIVFERKFVAIRAVVVAVVLVLSLVDQIFSGV
jgi:hypothetical protein